MVGWDVRETMPEALVSEALRRALAVRRPAGLLVHSDEVTPRRHLGQPAHGHTLRQSPRPPHGAEPSMSRRGNCYDNAQAESCWSRLKTELLDGGSFPSLEEARLELSHYIAYYNNERRHSALGYHSPNHFETHLQTTSQ